MKSALITGCSGFIGSNLARKLQDRFKLYGYDNLHSGRMENLHRVDIETVRSVELCPRVDYIFHLGIPSSSQMYVKSIFLVNSAIDTTLRVLSKATWDKAQVIYASSSSLYNGNKPPFREDMHIFVKDYYAEVRLFIERLMELYSGMYGVRSVGLRLFSVYGPNDAGKGPYANVVTQFATDMIRGKQPLLYGDGNQSRDFIHIDDVVKAFLCAMNHPETNVFNVGTGVGSSFNDAVGIINTTLGTKIEPKYIKKHIHNYIPETRADIAKAHKKLGFTSEIPFTEGLHNHALQLKEVVK